MDIRNEIFSVYIGNAHKQKAGMAYDDLIWQIMKVSDMIVNANMMTGCSYWYEIDERDTDLHAFLYKNKLYKNIETEKTRKFKNT